MSEPPGNAGPRRPESVLVVVVTVAARFLLMRRRSPVDYWQSVTGSLAAQETPALAARRELLEETGLIAGTRLVDTGIRHRYAIAPAWRHRYPVQVTENTEHVFVLVLKEAVAIKLNTREHAEFGWFDVAGALMRVSSKTNREQIERLAASRGRTGGGGVRGATA